MASFNEVLLLHNTPLDSERVQRDQDAPAGSLGEKWKKRKEEKRVQKEGAAEKDAENPVKFEKKKRSLLGRLLGRGHEDEVGLSGQDVKATLREGGEGEREM